MGFRYEMVLREKKTKRELSTPFASFHVYPEDTTMNSEFYTWRVYNDFQREEESDEI